jgi:hypothetical protein
MQEDCGSTPSTDMANQACYPFGVGKIGSSLYIVGYCYIEDCASLVQRDVNCVCMALQKVTVTCNVRGDNYVKQ